MSAFSSNGFLMIFSGMITWWSVLFLFFYTNEYWMKMSRLLKWTQLTSPLKSAVVSERTNKSSAPWSFKVSFCSLFFSSKLHGFISLSRLTSPLFSSASLSATAGDSLFYKQFKKIDFTLTHPAPNSEQMVKGTNLVISLIACNVELSEMQN